MTDPGGLSSDRVAGSRMRTLGRALRLVAGAARRPTVMIGMVQLLAGLVTGLTLVAAGRVVEGLTGDGASWANTWPWVVVLGIATTVLAVAETLSREYQRLVAEIVERHTSQRLIKASASAAFERFDTAGFYDQLTRATEGSRGSASQLVLGVFGATRTLIDLVIVGAVIIVIVPVVIPLVVIAAVPLFVAARLGNNVAHRFRWALTEDDRRRRYLFRLFGDRAPAREIRLFGLGRWLGVIHDDLWADRLTRVRQLIRTRVAYSSIGALLSAVVVAVALGLVAWMAARGSIGLSDAAIGVLGVRQLASVAGRLNSSTASLHQGALQMQDYDDFVAGIDADDGARPEAITEPAATPIERVEFHDVSFSYAGMTDAAVRNINLSFVRGQVTAVVGPNGSGKSTLMMLLAGLYEADDGAITWDGVDVRDLAPSQRWRAVAPMFQNAARYQLSANDNVAASDFGQRSDLQRVRQAVDDAGAAQVIDRLDAGLATMMGVAFTEGTELSAGQWQRLALARALFRPAPLLILDEPSSDLDALAEQQLVDHLAEHAAERCTVLISHRFAAVRRADRIIVLAAGRVVEQGTHAELLASEGLYAQMYRAQVGT